MEKPSSSLSASSVCITFSSWFFLWPVISLSQQALISRNYRGDVDMSMIDKFLPMVLEAEEEGTVSPILIHDKVTFVYIKHNNLYCILVWRERERERGGRGEFMCVHVYEGERRVNTLCLLYENSFPLRNALKIKDLKSW